MIISFTMMQYDANSENQTLVKDASVFILIYI